MNEWTSWTYACHAEVWSFLGSFHVRRVDAMQNVLTSNVVRGLGWVTGRRIRFGTRGDFKGSILITRQRCTTHPADYLSICSSGALIDNVNRLWMISLQVR